MLSNDPMIQWSNDPMIQWSNDPMSYVLHPTPCPYVLDKFYIIFFIPNLTRFT